VNYWPRTLKQALVQVTGIMVELALEGDEQTCHRWRFSLEEEMRTQQKNWLTLLDSI
jgi:hypothetical protein